MYSVAPQPLSECKEHSAAHIQSIQTDNATRIRLLGMGLGHGTHIEVLRNRHGDMVLGNGNNRISLGVRLLSIFWYRSQPHESLL